MSGLTAGARFIGHLEFHFALISALSGPHNNEGRDCVELALPIYSSPDGRPTHVIDKRPYLTAITNLKTQIQTWFFGCSP